MCRFCAGKRRATDKLSCRVRTRLITTAADAFGVRACVGSRLSWPEPTPPVGECSTHQLGQRMRKSTPNAAVVSRTARHEAAGRHRRETAQDQYNPKRERPQHKTTAINRWSRLTSAFLACSAFRKQLRLREAASMTSGEFDMRNASFIRESRSEKAPLPEPDTRDASASPGTHAGTSARRASLASSDCETRGKCLF